MTRSTGETCYLIARFRAYITTATIVVSSKSVYFARTSVCLSYSTTGFSVFRLFASNIKRSTRTTLRVTNVNCEVCRPRIHLNTRPFAVLVLTSAAVGYFLMQHWRVAALFKHAWAEMQRLDYRRMLAHEILIIGIARRDSLLRRRAT